MDGGLDNISLQTDDDHPPSARDCSIPISRSQPTFVLNDEWRLFYKRCVNYDIQSCDYTILDGAKSRLAWQSVHNIHLVKNTSSRACFSITALNRSISGAI